MSNNYSPQFKNNRINYSFAPIDILNYICNFQTERRKKLLEVTGKDIDELIDKDPCESVYFSAFLNKYLDNIDIKDYPSGDFSTLELLKKYLFDILNSSFIPEKIETVIIRLQKKFEVFGRIFDSYDEMIMKNSDSFMNLEVYLIFSIIMSLRFRRKNNYNDLNTAIKLNDLVLYSGWKIKPEYKMLLLFAVFNEEHIMKSLK